MTPHVPTFEVTGCYDCPARRVGTVSWKTTCALTGREVDPHNHHRNEGPKGCPLKGGPVQIHLRSR